MSSKCLQTQGHLFEAEVGTRDAWALPGSLTFFDVEIDLQSNSAKRRVTDHLSKVSTSRKFLRAATNSRIGLTAGEAGGSLPTYVARACRAKGGKLAFDAHDAPKLIGIREIKERDASGGVEIELAEAQRLQ